MRRLTVLALALCAWAFAAASPAGAQSNDGSAVSGQVTDVSGARIAAARVTLTNRYSGAERSVVTNNQGAYEFGGLLPGEYTVEASADRFQAAAREVTVELGRDQTISFELAVSGVAESVTVSEDLEKVPGGVGFVPRSEIEQSRAYNLKDVLDFVPGVVAQSRFGADETKFSIRGSGLRSNYHHRGINLYINGLPYQEADGFSDFEVLELAATQSVEVWKGANALRFGSNTMGGAVNFVTQTGQTASPLSVRIDGGSYGLFKAQVSTGGTAGPLSYFLSLSDTELDGYRDHSGQGRQRFYGLADWKLTPKTTLRFDLIYANIAENLPGALTREELRTDPRMAEPQAVISDWGRYLDFTRFGTTLTHQIDDDQEFSVSVYGQYRNLDHPVFQVLDQDVRNFGGEARYRVEGNLGDMRDRLVVGFAPQFGNVGERRSENVNGMRGALASLQGTRARNVGLFFENQLDVTERFTFVAGGRADWAKREFIDEFLSDGDRSDERDYKAFAPKIGVVWRAAEAAQVFGNVSRSYEVPLLLELTSFGPGAGFLDLDAQDTWQYEVGTRGQAFDRVSWEVSFFDAEIDDEIINTNVQPFPFAPFTIPSYRNADQTRHLGLEVGAQANLARDLARTGDALSFRTAYTYSNFRFVGDPVYGDNQLAGAPRHMARAELRYEQARGFWIAPNVDWSPETYFADSANTVAVDKWAVLNVKAGYDWEKFGVYVEGANLNDRVYAASAYVDTPNGRYFEPGVGRAIYGGFRFHF